MIAGEAGSIKLIFFSGLVMFPAAAETETVCGVVIPLRVAVATPLVVVVTAEMVPFDVVENVTTVPFAMTPLGPTGVTVAVSVTGELMFAWLALVVRATESGAFGS
jgi:hypothetical protein